MWTLRSLGSDDYWSYTRGKWVSYPPIYGKFCVDGSDGMFIVPNVLILSQLGVWWKGMYTPVENYVAYFNGEDIVAVLGDIEIVCGKTGYEIGYLECLRRLGLQG